MVTRARFYPKIPLGTVYGRLTVISNELLPRKHYYLCRCSCGKELTVLSYSLTQFKVGSCGCWQKDSRHLSGRTHGLTDTPIYRIWAAMKRRCTNKNTADYPLYGGRGISVCKSWINFESFYKDMASTYKFGLSIDRIDNNGNYCPENCRWATQKEQSSNKRNNVKITFNGKTMGLAECSKISGLPTRCIESRVRLGWSPADALLTPWHCHRGARNRNKCRRRNR